MMRWVGMDGHIHPEDLPGLQTQWQRGIGTRQTG